jgi:hypothetical protein
MIDVLGQKILIQQFIKNNSFYFKNYIKTVIIMKRGSKENPQSYFDFLLEHGYIADDEHTSTSDSSDSDTDTDEDKESEYLINKGRNRKELHFILNHAIKHPPKMGVDDFKCAMCFDRLSKRWNSSLERKYQQIIKGLEKK